MDVRTEGVTDVRKDVCEEDRMNSFDDKTSTCWPARLDDKVVDNSDNR